MNESPSAIAAAFGMLKALRVRRPQPVRSRRDGEVRVDHTGLAHLLQRLADGGIDALADSREELGAYRDQVAAIDPDSLGRSESLAFWLNLYNAGALDLAATTAAAGESTVLRVPGAFDRPWAQVAGESLSLNDIEHGKVRRFGDPRIHAALVCGSASCPTLRYEPYRGEDLEAQLETQMVEFLRSGGASTDGARLLLSRIFLWYGSDFVRPHRMPSLLPVGRTAVGRALQPWLEPELVGLPVTFQSYDWGLSCSIG